MYRTKTGTLRYRSSNAISRTWIIAEGTNGYYYYLIRRTKVSGCEPEYEMIQRFRSRLAAENEKYRREHGGV